MDKRWIALEIRAVQVGYRDAMRQRGNPHVGDTTALRSRARQLLDDIAIKIEPDADDDIRRQLADARRELEESGQDPAGRG